jgi:hypothetical protein
MTSQHSKTLTDEDVADQVESIIADVHVDVTLIKWQLLKSDLRPDVERSVRSTGSRCSRLTKHMYPTDARYRAVR